MSAFEFNLAQALGFLSYLLGLYAFTRKDDRQLKIALLVFNLNHMLHFFLLNSLVSSLSAFISALRTGFSLYTSSFYVVTLFVLTNLILGLVVADGMIDLLPVAGVVVGTFSLFRLQGVALRLGCIVGAGLWLINNIIVGSIGGTLLEATFILLNLWTIYRIKRDGLTTQPIEKKRNMKATI